MPAGVRYDWVDCVCCSGGKCCKYGIHAPLPFTPDEGFNIESIDVSNNGQNQCVGRAVADIVLWKPADPQPDCVTTGTPPCGRYCKDGFHAGSLPAYPGTDMPESLALFNAWMAQFPVPAGWERDYPIDNLTGWTTTQPPCNAWYMDSMSGNAEWWCPSECSATTKKHHMFRYDVPSGEKYYSTQAARDAAAKARFDAICGDFNTWWANDAPTIRWTKGTCEYELTPNRGTPISFPSSSWSSFSCLKYVSTNPPASRWVFCASTLRFIPRTYWTVRCASEPCAMPDYDWPLTLPCSCTEEYSQAGVGSKPECILYLDSSGREYSGDRCKFIARYAGAIEAGQIECLPGTTDPNCKCCGEPAP